MGESGAGRHPRRSWATGALVLLLGLLLLALVLSDRAALRHQPLGDATAPRAPGASTSHLSLPRDGESLPASQGDQARAVAWDAAALAQQHDALLAAYRCVRAQQGAAALTLDPALSQAAALAGQRLLNDPHFALGDLSGPYLMRAVLPLGATVPTAVQPASSAIAGHGDCATAGLAVADLTLPPAARTIGVAILPPRTSWDLAVAVVLVKE